MFGCFDKNRAAIENQYRNVKWNEESGLSVKKLEEAVFSLADSLEKEGTSRAMIRAKVFEMVMDQAQLAVAAEDFFQDHINHGFVLQRLRNRWIQQTYENDMPELFAEKNMLAKDGVMTINHDFGHTAPDWYDITRLGFSGLLSRVERAHEKRKCTNNLTSEQDDYYNACEIVLRAVLRYLIRLSKECRSCAAKELNVENAARLSFCADTLEALACRAPETTHEALQLAYIYHILQEEIEGERLRTLGILDRVYRPFYESDLFRSRFTKEEISELYKDFFQKFHALTGDQLFGEPMCLGGMLPDGACCVNDLTYLILDSYDALDIANPKFHIRISKNTPPEFIRRICEMIRGGNSSFVFVSDECGIPMMMKVGASLYEAREFVPIGCYEPGILGREVACTGNGGFNLPKMMELALHDGVDPMTGRLVGTHTGDPAEFDTFDKLINAVREQMKFFCDKFMTMLTTIERHYMKMNPAPLFSATSSESVEKGADLYSGGAKYNNSSIYMYSNATLADSLAMIKKMVYEKKKWRCPS